MRFYSKKGVITGVLLWGVVLFLILTYLFLPGRPEEKGAVVTYVLITLIISGFMAWFWFGTYYEIKDSTLRVVAGPFRWKIDILTIINVKRTRNPLSSPALSLDRLEVRYGKWGIILISPKNEVRFGEELVRINPKISINL